MFDFFRDMALEIRGVNSDEVEKQRKEQYNEKQKQKFIFSMSTKVIIFVLGILYILTGGISLYASIKLSANISVLTYVKYALLSVIDIAALICISMKKRETEIAAVILVIVFCVVMYMSTVFALYF